MHGARALTREARATLNVFPFSCAGAFVARAHTCLCMQQEQSAGRGGDAGGMRGRGAAFSRGKELFAR
jgi:hypothetical protein